ncbi:DUF4279 domain-containing protein [Ornithinibacillus xuwenensis]|uniref:DUF4279 domain-containing protein n=1 Tax=Ornithinibacillus xuwenensis TaxID=3144668 RepID=A0ABU9XDL9_9BACI
MTNRTSVEVFLSFIGKEPNYDFSLSTVTDKLRVTPTSTSKKGEQIGTSSLPERQYSNTIWMYSTGRIETYDFEMVTQMIVRTFKDKVRTIKELIRELEIEPWFCAITSVEDGISPGYSLSLEVMDFAISIGAEFEIDQYVSGFVEDDLEEV